jgi:hypothetical protein
MDLFAYVDQVLGVYKATSHQPEHIITMLFTQMILGVWQTPFFKPHMIAKSQRTMIHWVLRISSGLQQKHFFWLSVVYSPVCNCYGVKTKLNSIVDNSGSP